MLFAGVIEFTPEQVALILGVLLLLALGFAAVGGAIAHLVARERGAFWLGSATCIGTTLLLASTIPAHMAAAAGLASSAGAGLVLRGTQHRN